MEGGTIQKSTEKGWMKDGTICKAIEKRWMEDSAIRKASKKGWPEDGTIWKASEKAWAIGGVYWVGWANSNNNYWKRWAENGVYPVVFAIREHGVYTQWFCHYIEYRTQDCTHCNKSLKVIGLLQHQKVYVQIALRFNARFWDIFCNNKNVFTSTLPVRMMFFFKLNCNVVSK